MTVEYTIRFINPKNVDRTIGCVLLNSETDTLRYLIGGYYFTSNRSPAEMFAAFEEEGYEVCDFENFQFAPK